MYIVSDSRLCVEIDKHRTITLHTSQPSQTKGNKRNDCARKEEAFAPLLKVRKTAFEVWRNAFCQGHKRKPGWHACFFPSLLSSIIKTEKTGTTSHPFSWTQRRQLCPVHTWIPDKEAASCRATAVGLQATHTRPYKGTPFNSAARLKLCLWQHLSMHIVVVPPGRRIKHIFLD